MPPTARRRQIRSGNDSEDSEEEGISSRQRTRPLPPSEPSSDDDDKDVGGRMDMNGESESLDQLARKLVRYALACEYQRIPISRTGIKEKVMEKQKTPFKQILARAQEQLREKFGMELVELPAKENITVKGRLQSVKKTSQNTSKTVSSYILLTILPHKYRIPDIMPPSIVGSMANEASYIGLYTILVSMIALSTEGMMSQRLFDRNVHRLTPDMSRDAKEALLKKMEKQGYIFRTVEKTSDDEVIEYRVGPRGKAEIGNRGVMMFVKEVYGDDAPPDLEERLHRSLGIDMVEFGRREAVEEGEASQHIDHLSRSGGARRQTNDDPMIE